MQSIVREKQLKKFLRQEKLNLIRETNPLLADLSNEIWQLVDDIEEYPFYQDKNEVITLQRLRKDRPCGR